MLEGTHNHCSPIMTWYIQKKKKTFANIEVDESRHVRWQETPMWHSQHNISPNETDNMGGSAKASNENRLLRQGETHLAMMCFLFGNGCW